MVEIRVVKKVLQANDLVAAENRKVFKEHGLFAVNMISAPGSGKTMLLEKTLPALKGRSAVIVGDLETTRDAERISPHTSQVTQINTGMSCHLYANQIRESLPGLDLKDTDYLFIENVGNMVCPGEFDLGENAKVILFSVPEGDDKAAKYPTIFRAADIVLLTKSDLLGKLPFNLERVKEDIAKLNAGVEILAFSSFTGEGMERWLEWLRVNRKASVGAQARYFTDEH